MADTRRFVWANFSRSTLAANLAASATQLRVAEDHGDRFPSPDGTYDEIFSLVVTNGPQYEIMYCTGRSGDFLTVERGKEGTTALLLPAGANVAHVPTSEFFAQMQRFRARLISLSPETVLLEGGIQEIEITGEDFHEDAVAYVNGTPRSTFWDSDTTLFIDLTEADVAALGTIEIYVVNPDTLPSNVLTVEVVEPALGIEFLAFEKAEVTQSATTLIAEIDISAYIADNENIGVGGHFITSNGNTVANIQTMKAEVVHDGVVVASQFWGALGDSQIGLVEVTATGKQVSLAVPNGLDPELETLVRVTYQYGATALRRGTLQVALFANTDSVDFETVSFSRSEQFDGGGTAGPLLNLFMSEGALIWTAGLIASFDNDMTVIEPATGYTVTAFDDVASVFNHGVAYQIGAEGVTEEEHFIEWTAPDPDFGGHAVSGRVVYPVGTWVATPLATIEVGQAGDLYGWSSAFVFGDAPVAPSIGATIDGIYYDDNTESFVFSGLNDADILAALQNHWYVRIETPVGFLTFDTQYFESINPNAAGFVVGSNGNYLVQAVGAWINGVGNTYTLTFWD